MYDQIPWSVSVMSATTVPTRVDVSSVGDLEYQMPTTVRNARYKKKIEMDVLKL